MVHRHPVVLTVALGALLVALLSGCSDDTPAAFDSDLTDHAAAARVWQDPWAAPTAATVAGPRLGSNSWVSRVVGHRTTPYDASVEAAAAAELAVAADAGWSPTSSSCGDDVRIALRGPSDAVAALLVAPGPGGSEAQVAVMTRHHLDEDWSVPEASRQTCLDSDSPDSGTGSGSDSDSGPAYEAPPDGSEPMRSTDLPDEVGTTWQKDELPETDAALLAEVNADLADRGIGELPAPRLVTGENRRPAAGTEVTLDSTTLAGLGRELEGWDLTWTACGGGGPDRATYVRAFDQEPAVARATMLDGVARVRFTLPVVEGPPIEAVVGLKPLTGSPCLTGEVDRLTVRGTPAVLPDELTPIRG